MAKGEFFKELPPWAKGVLTVGVLVGVGFGVYAIHRAIKNKQKLEGAKKETDAVDATAASLSGSGQKPTLDALRLATVANQLYAAMNGYGTDVKAVYAAFTN